MMRPPPGPLRYGANLSMLFAELPVEARPKAAAEAGFSFAESWWPFDRPVPAPDEADAFCRALDDAGVRLIALNLDAGDPARGDRGLLTRPDLGDRVAANLDAAAGIARRTGCRIVNALWGNHLSSHDPAVQDAIAFERLVAAADRLSGLGATVVVETLNLTDSPAFPLTDIRATADLVRRAGARTRCGNVGLLLDTYHLATMGTGPAAALREFAPLIRHVQFADAPGRGRPGTGAIDFGAVERALLDIGYEGFVGLEYAPGPTKERK